jgi:O-antigen/teichoic acid export membrane protein
MATLIAGLCHVLLILLLGKLLSPEQYGIVAVFQSLVVAFTSLAGLNTLGAASRRLFDIDGDESEVGALVAASIIVLLITSACIGALVFMLRGTLSSSFQIDRGVAIAALFVASTSVIVQTRQNLWQFRQQSLLAGSVQVLRSITDLLLSAAFLLFVLPGAGGRIAGLMVTTGLLALPSYFLLIRDGLCKFKYLTARHFLDALSFGVPLTPHVLGKFILNYSDRLIIVYLIGLEDAGVYALAAQLALVLELAFASVNNAFAPWLYNELRDEEAGTRERLVRRTYVAAAVIAVICGLAAALSVLVLEHITGSAYRDAKLVLLWLILGQSFNAMYLLVTNYLFFVRRTGLLSVASICTGCGYLVALLIVVPIVGIQGAAAAFAGAMALRLVAVWAMAAHVFPMPWFGLQR